MTSEQRVVVGQLGCGYWGPNLLRNFSAQPGCHVKWVAEQSPERRAYVEANYPRTLTTGEWEEVVCDPEVEALVIATPASTHHHLAKAALEAGKHVLVEKPLAMTTREADDLVSVAEASHRALMAGHTFLYNGAVRYVKRLLEQGELGQVYYIRSERLNLGLIRSDANAWWNLAPHDVSVLLYLMDNELPVAVAAHGMAYIQDGIEDVVFATITWTNGMAAHVHTSWLDPGKVRKMTLVGSRKMVVYDDVSDDKIAVLDKGIDRVPRAGEQKDYDSPSGYQLLHRAGDVWLPRVEFREPLRVEVEHFLHCVRTGETPLSGPRHARNVVAVLEAVDHSIRGQGCRVAVQQEGAEVQ